MPSRATTVRPGARDQPATTPRSTLPRARAATPLDGVEADMTFVLFVLPVLILAAAIGAYIYMGRQE